MSRSTHTLIASLTALTLLSGCAKVIGPLVGVEKKPTPQATDQPLSSPVQVQSFELDGTHRMTSNVLLLWRQDPSGVETKGQVARASRLADLISEANDLGERLNAEAKALREACNKENMDACDDMMGPQEYMDYLKDLGPDGLSGINGRIREKTKALRAAGSGSKAAALSGEISTLSSEREKLEISIRANEKYKALFSRMNELVEIDLALAKNEVNSVMAIDEIQEVVDYYQKPPTTVLVRKNPAGQIEVEIQEWATDPTKTSVASGEGNFSTREASIDGVSYQSFGGRLKFNVRPSKERIYYSFELTRSSYAKGVKDGRVYYSGDVTLRDQGGKILRRGSVKLGGRAI